MNKKWLKIIGERKGRQEILITPPGADDDKIRIITNGKGSVELGTRGSGSEYWSWFITSEQALYLAKALARAGLDKRLIEKTAESDPE